jgi:prepilin signal peptidase PulO-like enzyme (type II secretory pathway)
LLGWLAALCTAGWTEALLLAGLAWFFLAVAVIDLEQRLVLNSMLLPAVPLILLGQWLAGGPPLVSALLGGVTGFGCFLVLALIRPGSLGMGDVKLAGVVGLAVGIDHLGMALLVGVCAGGLASLLVLSRSGFRSGQTLAYAPYLVIGAWTALYARADLFQLLWKVVP